MKKSAGLLLFRNQHHPEVFLVHPGGPYWRGREEGAWSIPKGEFGENEHPLAAAIREFEEETGKKIAGSFIELQPVKLKSGKIIFAWAVEASVDAADIKSNTFQAEWPSKSGRWQTFPEVDKAAWYSLNKARFYLHPQQLPLLDQLQQKLKQGF